ncbi:enterobactin exporter EntS [compost metagenome]
MTTDKPAGFRKAVNVLRPGPFRRYMIGEGISVTGTWMQNMAQGWVMAQLTQSAFMLGLVNFASGLPMLLLTMTGGVFADRHDKRTILIIAQLVQIVTAITMGVLVLKGWVTMWHVMAIAVVLGVVQAFEMPAVSAFVPELVEKDEIADAIAMDRTIFHATRLVGPALAGWIIGVFGAAIAYFSNAFSFLALLVSLGTLKPRAAGTAEEEAERQTGMKEGFAYIRSDRLTMAMIGLMAANTVFVFPLTAILMPLYATKTLGLGPDGMGLLMAITGAGSVGGALGLLNVARDKRLGRLGLACTGMVLALLGLSMAGNFAAAAPLIALLAVSSSTFFGLANTTILERAPETMRGRVSSIAGLATFGLMPVAGLVLTSLADVIGIRLALGLAAGCFALAAAYTLLGPVARLNAKPAEG